jgi:hypothetical protein
MGSPGAYIESKVVKKDNTSQDQNTSIMGYLDKLANDKRVQVALAVTAIAFFALRFSSRL